MNIVDEYLKRYLRLIRVAEGEASENVARIRKANEKIVDLFEKTFSKKRITKIDLAALKVNISNIIGLTYNKELINKLSKDVTDLIDMEIDWHKKIFEKLNFGERVLLPNQEIIVKKSLDRPYQGRTFEKWFELEGGSHGRKINKIIQAGVASGASIDKVTRAILDISNLPKHHVRTLTRSAIMSSMNQVKSEFFDENKDLMDGKEWVSTLDARTTAFICAPRDGLKYTVDDEPIGHSLPWDAGPGWIHFNCRSTWVPIIDGISLNAPRAAVEAGPNYDKGDLKTRTGRVRKPTKPNREKGIFKIEQVTTRTKFEGWMRRQPTDYVADFFGGSIEKARRFKKGENLLDLHSSIFGSPLTVNTL